MVVIARAIAELCVSSLYIYLFIKALQHKCWRPVGHQILQPAKDIEFRTVCLKSCRQEKKFKTALNLQHPIYARTLTGVCQAIRIFSPCFFHVFISTGTYYFEVLVVEPNGHCIYMTHAYVHTNICLMFLLIAWTTHLPIVSPRLIYCFFYESLLKIQTDF